MRLFIGLPLPEDIRKTLQKRWEGISVNPMKDKTTKPSSWHLTVAFLDDVPKERLEKLEELVQMSMQHPPVGTLTIDAFMSFPRRNPTRIVANVAPEYSKLWNMFAEGVRDLASIVAPNVDRKQFQPHISVISKGKSLKIPPWSEKIDPIIWKPTELAIIKSTLAPDGSIYENLHVYPFDV